jgi:hypothetical protein
VAHIFQKQIEWLFLTVGFAQFSSMRNVTYLGLKSSQFYKSSVLLDQ